MKKQNLFSNYLYQLLYQVLVLVIPLILSPYLARTLRESALGIYTYVNSVAHFFVVAANLGIEIHGKRVIAKSTEKEDTLSRTFWSLFALHVAVSLAVLLVYLLFVALFAGPLENQAIYQIETIYVVSAMFDITWLFYGLENFSSVVKKNALVKIVECILIFSLVKEPADLGKYTWICAGSMFAGQAIMLPQAIRVVRPVKFTALDVRRHIKPLFSLSVVAFSVTLYTVLDKTLLGLMSTLENVAYYEYSHKIVLVPLMIVNVLGKVMMPRACRLVALKKEKEQKSQLQYAFLFTTGISMGAVFGLLAVSGLFARIYYGPAFAVCGTVIASMSPLVYIIGIGGILRSQYIIPNGMDRQFNACILLNAFINLTLNILLIPILGIYGAVIGSLAAELFGLCYQIVLCRKAVRVGMIFDTFLPFAGIGVMMCIAVRLLSGFLPQTAAGLLAEIVAGMVLYIALSCIYIRRHDPELITIGIDQLSFRSWRK